MSRYISCFKHRGDCGTIKMEIGSGSTNEEVEAGGTPCVINYNNQSDMFSPIRPSTCTIQLLAEDNCVSGSVAYFDVLPNTPLEVPVKISVEGSGEILFQGFVNSNVLSQPYDSNRYLISFEASDPLTISKYLDYELVGTKASVVTFRQIVEKFCDKVGITEFRVANTKGVEAMACKMSELNFFSSDVKDAWKMEQFFEEFGKYFGYTAVMWRGILYFLDQRYMGRNSSVQYKRYYKQSGSFRTGSTTLNGYKEIVEGSYKGSGSQVSISPIYNKVKVTDSFFDINNYLPDWFNQDDLTNRYGELYDVQQLNIMRTAKYETAKGGDYSYKDDEECRNGYIRRLYDNKYYDSQYYNTGLTQLNLTSPTASTAFTQVIGGTLTSLADLGKQSISNSYEYYDVDSNVSWKNYLMIPTLNQPDNSVLSTVVYNYDQRSGTTRSYRFIGSDFTSGFTDTEVFKLKTGWTQPFIYDKGETYISLNVSAIYERYFHRYETNPVGNYHDLYSYIFDEWYKDAPTGTLGNYGFGYRFYNMPPLLLFKFSLSGKYWNGSTWQDNECAFTVELENSYDDDGNPNYNNWNDERSALNNVNFRTFVGTGYKIALDADVDATDEPYFAVCLPAKLLGLRNLHSDYDFPANSALDSPTGQSGVNGYVWLSDFSMVATCTGNEESKKYDSLWENETVINSGAVNEMETSFKFTTVPTLHRLSYSNVGASTSGYLSSITETSIGVAQIAEKNHIQRYVEQYNTPTMELSLNLDDSFSQIGRFKDTWTNKIFVATGGQYDLREGTVSINIIESKQS